MGCMSEGMRPFLRQHLILRTVDAVCGGFRVFMLPD